MDFSDDDVPALSADTLSILQSFYQEQKQKSTALDNFGEYKQQLAEKKLKPKGKNEASNSGSNDIAEADSSTEIIPTGMTFFQEDWQLSQFWYDTKTCDKMCSYAEESVRNGDMIIFLSCPTAFVKFVEMYPDYSNVRLLEVDTRFAVFDEKFVRYDLNEPMELHGLDKLQNVHVGIIFIDPPFLNEDCLKKTMVSVKLLSSHNNNSDSSKKTKILLNTGAVMKPIAKEFGLYETNFLPTHSSGLSNVFYSYSNFETDSLKWV
ncbi:Protein-lysine N-methyltransferase n6amt2 [Smittium culicis]|uniref:Protein-lysine N-methyltransferase n6amt2 n=1 Tax=Smittium culicis TaxID=133412 RepID=A0A1R1YLR1_9FUNG|nr:Protein-lysine N-methyltransferase n6amt2 [Smittium culicis]